MSYFPIVQLLIDKENDVKSQGLSTKEMRGYDLGVGLGEVHPVARQGGCSPTATAQPADASPMTAPTTASGAGGGAAGPAGHDHTVGYLENLTVEVRAAKDTNVFINAVVQEGMATQFCAGLSPEFQPLAIFRLHAGILADGFCTRW